MTVERGAALRCVIVGAVVVGLIPGAVMAATRGFAMSSTTAAPGDEISVEIHDHYIAPRTDLYMVLASGWDDTKTCGEVLGAIKVGVVEWKDPRQVVSVGVATFTVPAVDDGEYRLGEDVGATEIPACASAGSLTITAAVAASTTPDDVTKGGSALTSCVWLVILGLAAFTAAVFLWRRKPR